MWLIEWYLEDDVVPGTLKVIQWSSSSVSWERKGSSGMCKWVGVKMGVVVGGDSDGGGDDDGDDSGNGYVSINGDDSDSDGI